MDIVPSILGVKKRINYKALEKVTLSIHLDVADGRFVKNTASFPPSKMHSLPTALKKEVHLMVAHPERRIAGYGKASLVFVHAEVLTEQLLKKAKAAKIRLGLAINPTTKLNMLSFTGFSHILLMGINPGKSGRPFIPETLKRIRWLKEHTSLPITVDGGVSEKNIKQIANAGASRVVMASHLFDKENPAEYIQHLKKITAKLK